MPGRENIFQQQRRLLDQAGARRRQQLAEERRQDSDRRREENRKLVAKSAGRIPVLESIDSVRMHARPVAEFMSNHEKLSFPVFQIVADLDAYEVFAALPQNHGNRPNVVAHRRRETSVGPHFDNYGQHFSPWILHENLKGTGTIRAAFLSRELFAGYTAMANSLPNGSESEQLLADNRAAIGLMVLSSMGHGLYAGEIAEGTRTFIWQGDRSMPPAVHDIERDGPGDYKIFAHQSQGQLGVGFRRLR